LASAPKVRKVQTKEDRKRPSVFIRLKTEEQFRGYALFEPDPELADNSGFFEYFSHWDQQGQTYVPCAGDKCPFCLANDNPATQSLTLWYFPDNDVKDRLKVFTMNVSTVRDMTDISEEEEGVLGKKFRIKRLSDKGEYRIRPLSDKALTKKEMKELLKNAPDLEEIVDRQLKVQWERIKALAAMEEDDEEDDDDNETDDDEEEETTAKKGKKKESSDDDDENDEDDEEESDEDEDEDEEESDDDDEEDEESDDDEEDEESENGKLEGVKLTVNSTNEDDETLNVTDSDGEKFDLWFNEGVEVDYSKIKKGTKITVDAVKDDEGDWVATEIKVARSSSKGKK
jgi:hypothetical protein